MNPYHKFVQDFIQLGRDARRLPLGGFDRLPSPTPATDAPVALFFSPHPDDECISGGPAIRTLREAGMRVINVAVTQGSNKVRQAPRLQELQHACDHLGLELVTTAPGGLERINPSTRSQDPAYWTTCVQAILGILQQYRPRLVLFPHDRDWNSTHIGVHYLVMDALAQMPADFTCYAIETEFWGALWDPNLMVEISPADLGDMITALTFHVGELQRNPYHLTLPAWMADNVRRGTEVVGGQGGAAPDMSFAVLCRFSKWAGGKLSPTWQGGRILAASEKISTLLV